MSTHRTLTHLFGALARSTLLAACSGGTLADGSAEDAATTPGPTVSYDRGNESEHGATLYQSSMARRVENRIAA